MTFASDNFGSYTAGDYLQSVGPYANVTSYSVNFVVTGAARVRAYASGNACVRHTTSAPDADYEVGCDLYIHSSVADTNSGVIGRASSSAATFYLARWRVGVGYQLFRFNSGTATQLGSTVSQSYSNGTTAQILLKMAGSLIEVYKDGDVSPIISVTDGSPITAAGFAGMYTNNANFTDGAHIDNWFARLPAGAASSLPPRSVASRYARFFHF